MIKTITLTGVEQEVTFDGNYTYYWVQNLSGADLLVSLSSGIVDGADNVLTIPSGGAGYVRDDTGVKNLYILGTGKVQAYGTNNAFCPFKTASGGGDSGGTVGEQVKILTGKASTSSEGNITITYDEPFSSPPLVVATSNRTAGNAGYVVSITLGGTTGFIAYIKQITSEEVKVVSADFTWVAIGT